MTETSPYVLFRDDSASRTTVFAEPSRVITAHTAAEFRSGLIEMEKARAEGKWLAGFMSYEAGYLFEEKLAAYAKDNRRTPLMSFGVFDGPADGHALGEPQRRAENEPFITEARAAWDLETYRNRFDRLLNHLKMGDCYQANLTMQVSARWKGDPVAAFWSLIERQPVKYGALVSLDGPILLSRSPELFFRVDRDGWIETHPMKGTAPRGATPGEDEALIREMREDPKSQAENRMIVDLLRNDISRITEVGTLDVPRLFDIETYPTVHQMVSHVRAKLLPDIGIAGDFRSALSLRLRHRRAEDAGDGNPARSGGWAARCLLRRHRLHRP